MTPQEVITEVRKLIQDETVTYRYSDTTLLGFVNQVLRRMSLFRPDLFFTTSSVATATNVVEQTLPTGTIRLQEVYRVTGGSAVTEVNRETLDQMLPGWTTVTAGTPVNWIRHSRNPRKYFLYPRPSSGITMEVEYSVTPSEYTIGTEITELPEAYFGAVVDGTVWLVESVDNENIGNGRADYFFQKFTEALGVDLSNRAIVDNESGAVNAQASNARSN